MSDAADLLLGAGFAVADRERWLALVDKVLKGARFEDTLVSHTYDGIEIQPLYVRGDAAEVGELPGSGLLRRGTGVHLDAGPWLIRASVAVSDAASANAQILEDLEGGAAALRIEFPGGVLDATAGGGLARLLEGVHLEMIDLSVGAGAESGMAADLLVDEWRRRGLAADAPCGSFGADPLGTAARTGTIAGGAEAARQELRRLALAARAWPRTRAIEVDGSVFSEAGATEAQELGAALANAVYYLRTLVEDGWDVASAGAQIGFRYSADTDVFATVAKLRAARSLWAHVLTAVGAPVEAAATSFDVGTAATMLSRHDPWVNILRTTAAAFAAGVGGATSVTVHPFDAMLGRSDSLARRIARNTQLLLQEESHVGDVEDPAGGSWYVESLTDEMIAAGWEQFVAIESRGGALAVLEDGSLREEIEAVCGERRANLATRRDPLTGISEFPNITEELPEREPWPIDDSSGPLALGRFRRAEQFEALRARSDAHKAVTGSRPQVFLANLGPVSVHTARATFAKNFFEAGGIEAIGNEGFGTSDDLIDAFTASASRLAVICSSDTVYASEAVDTASALSAAGAERIYLAGNPRDLREALEAGGVAEFIMVGANVITSCSEALDLLGAPS